MKKFVSLIMASAIMISMLPAAVFAGQADITATVKMNNAVDVPREKDDIVITQDDMPELRLKFTEVDTKITETRFTLTLENAEFHFENESDFEQLVRLCDKDDKLRSDPIADLITDFKLSADKKEVEFTVIYEWVKNDQLCIDLATIITKTKAGTKATVTVESKDITIKSGTDKVFATVLDNGIKASVKELVDVAEEEVTGLHKKGLLIEDVVKDSWKSDDILKLKLNKGFEFINTDDISFTTDGYDNYAPAVTVIDEREIEIQLDHRAEGSEQMKITGLQIEATTAEVGDIATLTVALEDLDKVTVDVAKVIASRVEMTVDNNADVPVYYSGVNVDNAGLTDDGDHKSLEITIKETFAGNWYNNKDFVLTLPEGVYVAGVDGVEIIENEMYGISDEELMQAFQDAYQEGEHKSFIFKKRTFHETNPSSSVQAERDPQGMTFALTLVADPGFVGDVVLTLSGDALDTEKITIARFAAPYTVVVEQNDLVIDYRYTELSSPIMIKEAEAGLWKKNSVFSFDVDRMTFEEEAVYTVDTKSALEIEGFEKNGIGFMVKGESGETAALVMIDGIELFMDRNIPAGPYELTLHTTMESGYQDQILFAPEHKDDDQGCTEECEVYVSDVNDYSDTIKDSFINVVTAGRDRDDAIFTGKVVIPIGKKQITVGEKTVSLDVAAYINMDNYAMLPVRAVATAFGVNSNNVLWDQDSNTVTILYGQRIITMVVGQNTFTVNGSVIPASTAVEMIGGRVFLPMRDLATALGVTDVEWDSETKTVRFNGNSER